MSDTYGVVYGDGNAPGLPPVNLPSMGAPPPTRVQIDVPKVVPQSAESQLKDWTPPGKSSDQPEQSEVNSSAESQLSDWTPPKSVAPTDTVSGLGAFGSGVGNALTFGAAPAIRGLAAAAGQTGQQASDQEAQAAQAMPAGAEAMGGADIAQPFIGAGRLFFNMLSSHPDPTIRQAYNDGRQAVLQSQQAAQQQHPWIYGAGQVAGSMMLPLPGMGEGALAARIGKGALTGAVGGGLYGAGSAIGAGEDVSGVAKDAVTGAAIGAPFGAALNGVLRPRLIDPNSAGQRAAQTAADLGAPLPRGLASDSASMQAVTQRASQIPILGNRIGSRAAATVNAAGDKIGEISNGLAPSINQAGRRSVADAVVRPGFQNAIDNNKQAIDAGYDAVRNSIDQTKKFAMPRTKAALAAIKAARAEAGHTNPGNGLEQFENVADGATFNGAHRARVDAREAGNPLVPHPGYNAADYNRLTNAMTGDIRAIVAAAAKSSPKDAVNAFDLAEREFGRLSEQNRLLHSLKDAKGEGAISSMLNAAREKGGNLRLLAQLKGVMKPHEWNQFAGTLLNELGDMPKTGEFSLSKFFTEWNKISDGAKRIMFSKEHREAIDAIAQLGAHLKGGDQYRNFSNTAGALILWDAIRAIAEGGVAYAAGLVNPAAAGSLAVTAAMAEVLTRYLASPAKAAAIGGWVKAYRAVTLGAPTPARTAMFTIATRNLANNLGVPVKELASIVQSRLSLAAQPSNDSAKQQ